MARPTQNVGLKPAAELTREQMISGASRLRKRIAEVQAFDPNSISDRRNAPAVDALTASIDDALVRTFGANTLDYSRYARAKIFDFGPYSYLDEVKPAVVRAALERSKLASLALLGQAITSLEEQLSELPNVPNVAVGPAGVIKSKSRSVFVVHGHNNELREAICGFLRKIGFVPIVLHEQANQGRTIIEKFEVHADVGFAVIILSPDDVGGAKGEPQQPRARQNVILELGYFIGRLGRAKVCAIKQGEMEIPTDILGVVWTPYDALWKTNLAKEMKAAGYEVDWNKVMDP